jgi:anionic cell wall polymer biosynthesis LytR-Cps2A-Psr (LCP) family protein
MKTVENVLGVPVDYYAVIEFSAFQRMIDEIRGSKCSCRRG